jgi:hypothetical protein
MSEPLYDRLEPELRHRAVPVEQDLEGLERVLLYFVELGELPMKAPPAPEPKLPAQIRETLALGMRAVPRVIGLRRSA